MQSLAPVAPRSQSYTGGTAHAMRDAIALPGDEFPALRENPGRRYLLILNTGSLSIKYSTAGPAHRSPAVIIGAGNYYEPPVPPINEVFIGVEADADPVAYTVVEG